jgi:hypothetical protein
VPELNALASDSEVIGRESEARERVVESDECPIVAGGA